LYVFLQAQDVTAQRAAEEGLRQSEERFRLLVETVRDYAIFMLDPQGHVVSWNAGAERSKGYAAHEIIGRHFRTFYPPEQQKSRHPEHELELALRDGRYEEEGWRIRKDGTRFWANVVITAVHDPSGRHVGFAKVTRDTTERRRMLQTQQAAADALARANEDLDRANSRLRRAADEQADFLAVTAHELRTPVGVVAGSAETLSRHWSELTPQERQEMLDAMASSAGRLRRLLSDLLTVSRLERRVLDLHVSRVQVSRLLATAASAARSNHPEAVLVIKAEEDAVVDVDVDRIAQAIDNLVGNALAHGAGAVHLSAEVVGRSVRIVVRDEGTGVEPDQRERLFTRFAVGTAGGTGLGLYIVRELAVAHGGSATYEAGTPDAPAGQFVITLPLPVDAP
jgi:PAS domain S-box-containing protein